MHPQEGYAAMRISGNKYHDMSWYLFPEMRIAEGNKHQDNTWLTA